ncbi:hypothetical protein [Spirosoma endbachense]|uniref:Uncharacterized protein n=1 Tax=Spirosoma endbachense TaxID=2666025 RepID=A0A6P1VL38_9BACT|nr:hypothetical protein [Spirosoma endbachense]QHV93773.1 hypothetical protein GJR95_01450 [Spirosoma endbachense]
MQANSTRPDEALFIDQNKYDQLPFAIQLGALLLWGLKLTSYQHETRLWELYHFNEFFAKIEYDEKGQPSSVRTHSTIQLIEFLHGELN